MMKDVILIDKPAGWTSFDVVAKIRGRVRADYLANAIKPTKKQLRVGHAGTLDPFATGLLIVLLGDACKKADDFLKLDKTYEFTLKLGEVSTTGDPEGEITPYVDASKQQIASRSERSELSSQNKSGLAYRRSELNPPVLSAGSADSESSSENLNEVSQNFLNPKIQIPTSGEVQKVLSMFTGKIMQTPPAYSAIKIDGKRAYKLAREGKKVEIPPRQVHIKRLELTSYEYPYITGVCDVSSGTYIRSLVEDIGQALGTGAYCKSLRRARIGAFDIKEAGSISDFVSS